ncbi:hypothetical protein HDR59_00370 [bacterium]|nr:hypothetical protein [bacterium]
MKAKYIIFFFMIFFNVNAKADVLSLFEKSLVQYCVPRTAEACLNKATYNELNNTCNCAGNLLYVDRQCRVLNCPAGNYIVLDNYSNTCPMGYGKFVN